MRIVSVLMVAWLLLGFAQGTAAEDGPAAGDLIGQLRGLALAAKAAVKDGPAADDLGDPKRWEIRGATAFTSEEIAKALSGNIDVADAARSIAPSEIDEFKEELRAKVAAGYQEHGFPDVKVQVSLQQDPKPSKIIISIDEGQCFMAGEVRVTGTKTIDATWLAQELTPAAEPPLADGQAHGPRSKAKKQGVRWPTGKPAWFDAVSLGALRRRVETLLSERGRVLANFTLEAKPDADQGSAPLAITFDDEGVPAKIGEILVTGNKRSSRERLLRFLDVQPGMLLTRDVTDRINDRLTNSGRFVKSNFKTLLPKKAGEPLKLQINVTEYDQAPPLDKPLSREEEVLVRFSRWARQFEDGDDDLLLQFTGEVDVQLIISPRHGILALVRGLPDGADANQAALKQRVNIDADGSLASDDSSDGLGDLADVQQTLQAAGFSLVSGTFPSAAANEPGAEPAPIQFAYLATENEIGIFSLKRQRKLMSVPPPSPLIAGLDVEIHGHQPPFEGRGRLMTGLGLSSQTKRGKQRHVRVRIKQAAAAALALAHLKDSHCTWEGDVLRVDYGDRCLRIDAATGRLVEFLAPLREPDEGQLRFTVAHGEFGRRAEAIKLAAADFPNDADAARPLSCVCKFLCDEVLAWKALADDPEFKQGATIGGKVTDLGLFEPLDELLVAACLPARARDEFTVPVANLEGNDEAADDLSRLLRTCALAWGIPMGDRLLPRDTWAWHLWREMTFRYAQVGRKSGFRPGSGVQQPSGGRGAVACLVISQLVPGADEAISAALAREGLQRLSLEEFQHDYSALLDQESFLGRYVWKLTEIVRGLDDEDLQWLQRQNLVELDVITPEAKETLIEVARLLHESNKPVAEALPRTLDTWWRLGSREAVETALQEIAQTPSGSYATAAKGQAGYVPNAKPAAPAVKNSQPAAKTPARGTMKQARRPGFGRRRR